MKTPVRPFLLHSLIRKEARSLLQYLAEASPWAKAGDQGKVDRLLAMARREREANDQLIRLSIKAKLGNPALGSYQEKFTDVNFLSLDHLVPLVITEHKAHIAELEWSLLTAPEMVRDAIRNLVRVKRDTLEGLESILHGGEDAASQASPGAHSAEHVAHSAHGA